jgi:methionyl-tRNA synthetase
MTPLIELPVQPMDPPNAVEWECPTCHTKQERYECQKCGRPLCDKCSTGYEFSEAKCRECLPPESKELFTLLADVRLALMRIQRNTYRRDLANIGEIARHYLGVMKNAGV